MRLPTKLFAVASIVLGASVVPSCKALPNHNWKCPYTYDTVTGCDKNGFNMTSKGTGTETVQTPDRFTACLAVSEYVHMDHPGRIHIVCDPDKCEDLGPVPMPGAKPQDFPSDGGFHVLDLDGGSLDGGFSDAGTSDPTPITCPNGDPPPPPNPCNPYVPDPTSLIQPTSCAVCFVNKCCQAFEMALNDTAVPESGPEAIQFAECWMDTISNPECPTNPTPNAANFNACMAFACTGACGAHNLALLDGGL